MALGSRALKRQAREALADFTDDGVYPPEWVERYRQAGALDGPTAAMTSTVTTRPCL